MNTWTEPLDIVSRYRSLSWRAVAYWLVTAAVVG